MDSSTSRECRKRDAFLGGPQRVARLTGSRSYERFTGNQIAKIANKYPAAYAATEHIVLVSSFAASLLIGGYAPLDYSDASGMNLMNIFKKKWDRRALDCTARNLAAKLGPLVPSHKPAGIISSYYADRYGIAPSAVVIVFSGDNPNSLAAFGLDRPGATVISLGTSDTIFGALHKPKPSAEEGHIFANPIAPESYMALVCWKNGSLTREYVRDKFARGSWEIFNSMLASTPPGNNGLIGFYFKEPEITPSILKPKCRLFETFRTTKGAGRINRSPIQVSMDKVSPAHHVRALIEGQFLSMRLHCGKIGLAPETIIATGGASVNSGILQIMADVFGCEVHTIDLQNSAALGAALRAIHGWRCLQAERFLPFSETVSLAEKPKLQARPNPANHKVYTALLPHYRRLEQAMVGKR